jgi:hypothetical protein
MKIRPLVHTVAHTLWAAPLLALAGCASAPSSTTPAADSTTAAPGKLGAAEVAVGQAVTAPLSDLNLVQAPIPLVLKEAQKSPYALPVDAGCDSLAAQVRAFDEVLGADLDVPPTPGDPGLVARGSKEVGNAAAGALKSAAEGIVPFRGWVRKLTGAERYSKEVAAAIAAGTVRRAYLKGLGDARGCTAPAAPIHPEPRA